MIATCFSNGSGEYISCFKTSIMRFPRSSCFFVSASRSEANWENASSSRYCARVSFRVPAFFFIAFVCAAAPTRDTESQTLIAGFTHALKSPDSRKICPSVIEMTFVGIYADTSPPWVSIIGSAVSDPAPRASESFAERSRRREWR